jgi:putative transposase
LRAENRVLRARLGPKRLRFADAERRCSPRKGSLTDAAAGPLTGFGHLIVDRDPLYTAHFRTLLQAAGVHLLRLPANSPNLNAHAERFVRSIKGECLRHIVPLGERHLRVVVREFVEHYHAERNHQGLDNVIPFPSRGSFAAVGRIQRRERLGGLLHFYKRKAA